MTTRFVCFGRRDGVPVERRDRPRVNDHHADAVLFGLLCREQRSLNQRAPGQDDDVAPSRRTALPNGIM